MIHANIYELFKKLFPLYAESVTEYFPAGKDTIRIRIQDIQQEFIFTFHDNQVWKFETIDMFYREKEQMKYEKDRIYANIH